MNRGKWIILGGVAALVVATLYAPYTVYSGPASTAEFRFGFFLCDPPFPDVSQTHDGLVAQGEQTSYVEAAILESQILLAEWAAIALVTAVLYFVFRQGKEVP